MTFPKLAYKYYGPYKVIEKIGSVAYKLELSEGAQIHNVFHISQLKPFISYSTPVYATLPTTTDLEAAASTPRSIIDRRLVRKGNSVVP